MSAGAVTVVVMAMFGCAVLGTVFGAAIGFLGGRRLVAEELSASRELNGALERQIASLNRLVEVHGEAEEAEDANNAARDELLVTYERALDQASATVDVLAAQRSKFARAAGFTVVS